MKIGTFLKYFVGLLAALIVAAVVVLMVIDFNDYKPEIQAQAKQATGRDLTIDGDIKLAISLNPALAVSGVSFANASWGSRPAMVTVDRFEAQVALIPLISGTIDIKKIILKGADILLEKNEKGQANYVFETAAAAPATESKPSADAPSAAPTLPVVRHVAIEDAKVTYIDAVSKQTIALVVEELSLKGDGIDAPLDLIFEGSYNGNPLAASGTLGAPSAMMDAGKTWPVDLKLEAGGAKIGLKGAIADVVAASGLDLAFSVEGESLATLSDLAGAPVPPIGPYSVKGKVGGDVAATVSISDLAAKIGGSDLSGGLSVNLSGKVPSIDGAFKSSRIDVADFVKASGPEKASEKPQETAPAPAPAKGDGRVFPNDPLPLDGLKAVNATVKMEIETLVATLKVTGIEVGLSLKGGDLNISPLKATVADGAVDGRVRLNGAQSTPSLDTNVKVSKFDAGKLLADMAITDLLEGKVNVNIDLKGQGSSVRALMAGLNGKTQVVMGAGRMKSTAIDDFVGGPAKILTELFVGKQSEYTVINCVVSQFDIKNGLATSKALLFDTDYATVSGKGTINLGTEVLDMEVDPQPKSATVNTAVPVVITGTLAAPSYGVNKLAAARKVGGILGGIVFPPALVVGLVETGTGEDNPCIKGAKGKPASKGSTPAAKEEASPLKAIEKEVGNPLKKLFGN